MVVVLLEPLAQVVDGEDLHQRGAEVLEADELLEQGLQDLDELVHVDLVEVLNREDFREERGEEELQFLPVLVGGGKHEEGLLFDGDQHLVLVGAAALEVVDLALPEDEGLGLERPLLEGDPPRHVLYVLHDEIHRYSVVPEAGDDDVRVDGRRQDEIPERFLDKLVVLVQHTHHAPSSLRGVPLQPPAEPDVV